MSKTAVIYTRVSTVEQGDNFSLPTQLEGCRLYAAEHGCTVVGEFSDQFTGKEMDRPGLRELEAFVKQHGVDVVIVYDIDRLSRIQRWQAVLEYEIEKLGATVEYVIGNYDKTPEGSLTKHLKAAIAEYEVRQREERSTRGRLARVRAGQVSVSHLRAPYGYEYVREPHKGRLVILESEAEVVRQIYAWLLDGNSGYTIARMLSERRIPTRGDQREKVSKEAGYGQWAPQTVSSIVHNPVYKGEWVFGKTKITRENGKTHQRKADETNHIPVDVPAIVDAATWEAAQVQFARNKLESKRNTKHDFLLRGMIVCACGRRWRGVYKSHLQRGYYRCQQGESRKWVGPECTVTGGVRQERLEEAVWEKVCAALLSEEYLRAELANRRRAMAGDIDDRRRRLEAIGAAVADIERKLNILLDQVLTGGFSPAEIQRRKEMLLGQKRDLETDAMRVQAEIDRAALSAEQEESLIAYAAQVRAGIDGVGFAEKRRVLELLNVTVEVIDQENFRVSAMLPVEGESISLPRLPRSRRRAGAKPDEQSKSRTGVRNPATLRFVTILPEGSWRER